MVIALASRSNWKRVRTSEPVGLWARRGSSPFPGAILPVRANAKVVLEKMAQFEPIRDHAAKWAVIRSLTRHEDA